VPQSPNSGSLPSVAISTIESNAIEAGPDGNPEPGEFLVTRSSSDYSQALTVEYSVAGTAVPGVDYSSLSGTVTIPADAVASIVTVDPIADTAAVETTTVAATVEPSATVLPLADFATAVVAIAPAPTAAVSQLTFGATNASDFHNVQQDGTSYIYDGPEWQAGQRQYPVCYTRSGTADGNVTMTVAAQLNVTGFVGGNYEVRGTWDGQQATANATLNGGVLSATLTETKPMTNVIDKATTDIKWETSSDGGKTWIAAGETKDVTYVVNGKPTGDQLLETVLNTGCVAAKGQKTYNAIVNSIWTGFQARTITRVDGTPMDYYGPVASKDPTPLPDSDFTTAGLIQYADGRCEAWTHFLIDVWGAQGVAAEYWGITPNANAYPAPAVGYTLAGFQVTTKVAQGGTASTDLFQNHAVVKLANGSSVYDPSYGRYFPSEQAWRDGMEENFVYNPSGGGAGSSEYIAHVSGKNIKDSTFTKM